MSASPSTDAYDAQMLDFSLDPDVPMNATGSAEFFAEALMDHDGHLAASTYAEHASVEIDMEEYVGDNSEYEMEDETAEYQRPHGDELLDIEVYDASHAPSPLVPPHPLQPSVDVSIDSEHPVPISPGFSGHVSLPEVQREPESEVHPTPLDHPSADAPHVEPSAPGEVISSEAVPSALAHPTDAPDKSISSVSESHEQPGDTARTNEQPLKTPAPADAHDEAEPLVPLTVEEQSVNSEVAQHESSEPSTDEPAPPSGAENVYDIDPPIQDEKAREQALATEGEAVDPLQISDGVYIDPPPAVLLSIADRSEPGFALFNQPNMDGESAESYDTQRAYSLLLETRPTLYYEPLSSVFEVLRQDEGLLSRVPHSFEGELVLDAYDLQLVVSEDNVHSREISLHDVNLLHDGSNFVGPLRLLLRAVVPRFIIRYYALQEQIQRLNVAETEQEEHDEERHEHYDTSEEQPQSQQEEVANHLSPHTSVSDGLKVPPTKELVKGPQPSELTEETPREDYEQENTFVVQEPAGEYHEHAEETIRALEDEDEDDYEDTNDGDEGESAKSDADQVQSTAAEDTNIATTVTEQESKFGDEQTEYLGYVRPEEYDERYGEDLPERAGMASSVQYGEPSHSGGGVQDTSTAVDQSQAILPGTEGDEEDKSVATPIFACIVLEPESSELTDESTSSKQEKLAPGSEESTTSESVNGDVSTEQASGNLGTSAAKSQLFSEVDKSDSNFVSKLERETDTEFDQTFNSEQSGQEGGIEATLQNDETWDEWDDEDAEGEDEDDWIDPDAASNESSVTLSSKASSKRGYDEVDPSGDVHVDDSRYSPGSKRLRIR